MYSKKKISQSDINQKKFFREPNDLNVKLCIQDWVCYENTRYKTLKMVHPINVV